MTNGYFIEDLQAGMDAAFNKIITNSDVLAFAEATGDTNPVHLDEAYAAGTMFKTRIAHGMLSAGLISAVIGTRLPGPGSIYLSQSLKFRAPVRIGDNVKAIARISNIDMKRRRVRMDCACSVGETLVLDGEALIMVPSRNCA